MIGNQNLSAGIHIIGGGLSSCILLLLLKEHFSDLQIKLYERNAQLCGNHTWCFHQSDVSAEHNQMLKPIISKTWPSHGVLFNSQVRQFSNSPYCAIKSSDLQTYIMNRYTSSIVLNCEMSESDIKDLPGLVFDGRGWPEEISTTYNKAYQKFVGVDVLLEEPHGQANPMIKDTSVDQIDGYRFVYTLPWSENQILIEDTYYSDTPDLKQKEIENRILDYAKNKGWKIKAIERIEKGVLPLPLTQHLKGSPANFNNFNGGFPIGARAGLLNSTTGYTLPETLKFYSQLLTQISQGHCLKQFYSEYFPRYIQNQSFFRLLNRMLFMATQPQDRLDIMRRFYTLPEGTIKRFYAGALRMNDKLRILALRPPVPLTKAIRCLSENTEVTYG